MTTAMGAAVDVWLAFYQSITDERLLGNLRTLLSDAEQRQETRFHFADDRLRYLVTRAMVRTVLSRYAALAPADWVFATNAYGRPEISNVHDDTHGLGFNISHTRGLIALAVARHRTLGIDVENVSARSASMGIAERFFSPREVAELATVAPAQRQDRFFEYWTFKEAYVKARGMGLSIPLDRFSFHYPNERAAHIAIDPALGDHAARWSFCQMRPTHEHLLAICAERLDGAALTLTVRNTVPTVTEEVLDIALLKCSWEHGLAHA